MESRVSGIERHRLAIFLERSSHVAGLFESRPFVVQPQRGESVLAFLVYLAQQCRQLRPNARGLLQLAVLAQGKLQAVERGLVLRSQAVGFAQMPHGLARITPAQIFSAEPVLRE